MAESLLRGAASGHTPLAAPPRLNAHAKEPRLKKGRDACLGSQKRSECKMPTYVYINKKTNEQIHRNWTIHEMLEQEGNLDGINVEGKFFHRDYAAEHCKVVENGCSGWPMKSDAAGVHPSQVKEFYLNSQKMGVPTQFDGKTGQAIFTSRAHRAKYLKSVGMHDRNGGYGDG